MGTWDGFPRGQCFADGTSYLGWNFVFNGGVCQQVLDDVTYGAHLEQTPTAIGSGSGTHASLAVGPITRPFCRVDATMVTFEQLRDTPNPWEAAWLVWHYTDNDHFYYVVVKPNGFELGKRDPAYPGGQRFLWTQATPTMTVGTVLNVVVEQRRNVIDVWVDGAHIVTFVDDETPYESGRVGVYNEDARVGFPRVTVTDALTGLGTGPQLGEGTYTAEVQRLSPDGQIGDVLRLPVEDSTALSWERRLLATSIGRIAFPEVPDSLADRVRTLWQHLALYRDGGEVWSGPITRKERGRGGLSLTAHDVSWWLKGRPTRVPAQGVRDLAPAAVKLVNDSHPGRAYEITGPAKSGILGNINRSPDSYRFALEELNTLAQLGLQWTVMGNRIYVGATIGDGTARTLRFPKLSDHDFLNELVVAERGDLAATDIVVLGANGLVATASAADVDDAFRYTRKVLRPNVSSQADLNRIADDELSARWPAPIVVQVPEDSQISPKAPADINHLVAGAHGVVEVTHAGAAAEMVLNRLSVVKRGGAETVRATLTPALA